MRYLLLIFLLSSCVTQRRCNEKFPPKETVVVLDSIVYRDTTIIIPPDTISFTFIDTCQDMFITQKGKVRVIREKGRMWVDCVSAPKDFLATLQDRHRHTIRTIVKGLTWWEKAFILIGKFFLFLLLASMLYVIGKRWIK
jgi:hypothetical protein